MVRIRRRPPCRITDTMNNTPQQRYATDMKKSGFVSDPAQATAVDALQNVYDQLQRNPPQKRLLSQRLRWPAVQGLYLWGGVGRGKTYLMDMFYESLPPPHKLRTHFHRFMLDVHARTRHYADKRDPLKLVALELSHQIRVLCFDEFFVSDIADAMILGRLMQALFDEGVTVVATSNCAPDELYRGGLQRQNFLPAIQRIKEQMRILNVDSGTDYRLRHLTRVPLYLCPSDDAADAALAEDFAEMGSGDGSAADAVLSVHGRSIKARRLGSGIAWLDFSEICEGPRGAADYIEMARLHHTVMVSGVPQLTAEKEDAARRFITMVDEFYDRGVKLILAADVPQNQLYAGNRLAFEFRRTQSRLQEMQSEEYLAKPHLH